MAQYLESIEPAWNTSLAQGVKDFCLCNSGQGILVLITDLMDKQGYESALRFLVAQRYDVYVIHVLSPEELEPDVKGDLKLIDCEDRDVAEISVSRPLLDRYKRTLAAFVEGAREFCTRRGMTYLMTSSQTPVEQIVSNYLRARGLVR
jgi:hypothetical protein